MSVLERLLHRHGDSDLTIEPMRKRDLRHGVMDIEAAAYPQGWSRNVFSSELDQVGNGTRYYATARRDGEVVGYAGLWFSLDEAHVTNVAVAPASRRSGVGRDLMLHLAEQILARDCVAWTLEVRVTSVGAQRMYESFGFVSAGVRQKYYDNVEDAIVMWCHGIQSTAYRQLLNELREGTRAS